jgi:hypothetical protein
MTSIDSKVTCFLPSSTEDSGVGILAMKGYDQKFVVQGIHMLFNGEVCDDWEIAEGTGQRRSKLVFIGVDLPHQRIKDDFEKCVFVEGRDKSRDQSQKKEN